MDIFLPSARPSSLCLPFSLFKTNLVLSFYLIFLVYLIFLAIYFFFFSFVSETEENFISTLVKLRFETLSLSLSSSLEEIVKSRHGV